MSQKKNDQMTYPWNFLAEVIPDLPRPGVDAEEVERGLEHLFRTAMKERSWTMIELKYKFGFTQSTIARQYGLHPSSVAGILQQEKRRLRHPKYSIFLLQGYSAGMEREREKMLAEEEAKAVPEHVAGTYEEPILNIVAPYKRIDAIFERDGDDDIWSLRLDYRISSILLRNGIRYIWQLCFCTENDLLNLRNMGVFSLSKIEDTLMKWDLALDDGVLSNLEHRDRYIDYAKRKMRIPESDLEE